MSKNNKLKYGRHSRPSPLLNEDSTSNLGSSYGRHSRPSPLLNEDSASNFRSTYGIHSRPSPLLNENSASNLESFLETPYGEHSRPAPLSPDIWKPHIYVYDKNNAENTIVQGTPSAYVLVTTQDSNLAGKTFFQNGDIQLYVDYTDAIKDELQKDNLRAFGIQMNESYIKQQQEKE